MTSLQMTQPTAGGFRADVRHEPQRASLGINVGVALGLSAAILVLFIAFAGDAAATSPVEPASSESADTIEIYVVKPGDTLWSIATGMASPGEDIRPLVDALNDIAGGASLDIGDQLIIDHAQIRG